MELVPASGPDETIGEALSDYDDIQLLGLIAHDSQELKRLMVAELSTMSSDDFATIISVITGAIHAEPTERLQRRTA